MPTSTNKNRRVLLGATVVLAPAVGVLADAVIAAAQGWRPAGTIEHGVLAAAAIWVVLVGAFLVRRGVRRLVGMLAVNLVVLVAAATFAWGLLEAGAAWTAQRLAFDAAFHTRGPSINRIFHPDPAHITGIEGASRYTTDEMGIRAPFSPAPRHAYRVLCVGGSTTECTYLDDYETWPALVMNRVNDDRDTDQVWVGNVGISGFSMQEHLRFIRTSPLLDDIDAIIVQPGINDLWRFLADEDDEIDYARFSPEQTPEPVVAPRVQPRRPLWSRSHVIQLYHDLQRLAVHQGNVDPVTIEGEAGREYGIRRERRAEATLSDALPDLQEGRRRFGERVESLIEAARRRGLELLFTTQPTLYSRSIDGSVRERLWFGWLKDGRYLTAEALHAAMEAFNATLRDTCTAQGVPCVDLSDLTGEPDLFYDDCHFTEAGAEAVAERVAPALTGLLQLPPGHAPAEPDTARR